MHSLKGLTTVAQQLQKRAECTPEGVAFHALGDTTASPDRINYGELHARACSIARYLQSESLDGHPVLLLYSAGIDYICALFGCFYAGVIAVPAYPPHGTRQWPRIRTIIGNSRAKAILSTQLIKSRLEDRTPITAMPWHATDTLYREQYTLAALNASTNEMALLQYTSGSTASPKGVMLSHQNLRHNCAQMSMAFPCQTGDVGVTWLPPYHDMGLIAGLLLPVFAGFTGVILTPASFSEKPARWLQAMSQFKAVISGAPNFAWDLCVEKIPTEDLQGIDLQHWRYAISGAEIVRSQSLRRFSEKFSACGFRAEAFYPSYGLAEATLLVTTKRWDSSAGDTTVNCGTSSADQSIIVVNPDTQQPCANGMVGEIWISGPCVAQGYWQNATETDNCFNAHLTTQPEAMDVQSPVNYLRTGDLGFLKEGELYVTGRIKEIINLGGRKFYPTDIELAAVQSDSVFTGLKNAAFSVNEYSTEKLIVLQEVPRRIFKDPNALTMGIWQALLQNCEVTPDEIALVPAGTIPRTTSGKVMRVSCRNLYLQDDLRKMASLKPHQLLQEKTTQADILSILKMLLNVESLDTERNFFELGGHSRLALDLAEHLRTRGYTLPINALMSGASISALIEQVSNSAASDITLPQSAPTAQASSTYQSSPNASEQTQTESFDTNLITSEFEQIAEMLPCGMDDIADIYPLTALQQGMLFHAHRNAGGGDVSLLACILRLQSPQNLEQFIQAFGMVVARHDTLRSFIYWEHSQPVQVVLKSVPVHCERIAHDNDPLVALQRYISPASSKLNLRKAPLFSLHAATDAQQSACFVLLQMHHMVSDQISMDILLEEVTQLMQAPLLSLTPALRFRPVVMHQCSDQHKSTHTSFFRSLLKGIDEITAPFGLTNVHMQPDKLVKERMRLETHRMQALRHLAISQGVSLAVIFHAAWAILVAKCSGKDDIVFGSVFSGRMRNDIQGRAGVGPYINFLPVRINIAALNTVELIRHIRDQLAGLAAHEQTPLADIHACSELAQGDPLYIAVINFRHSRGIAKPASAPVSVTESHYWSNYPLVLYIDDLGDALEIETQCDAKVTPAYINALMCETLSSLEESLRNAARTSASACNILPTAERLRLLKTFNATQTSYPDNRPFMSFVEENARKNPQGIAVIAGEKTLTWHLLLQASIRIARALKSLGIQRNQCVCVCVERDANMIIAVLGVIGAGAAWVPLDPDLPEARLHALVNDSQSKAVISSSVFQHYWQTSNTPLLLIETWVAEEDCRFTMEEYANAEDLAYVIYTSGSTGIPKGVMVEHRQLLNMAFMQAEKLQRRQCTSMLQFSSISFDAFNEEVFPAILLQIPLVIRPSHMKAPDAEYTDLLKRFQVSAINLPTAFWHEWVDLLVTGKSEIPASLRHVTVTGEAVGQSQYHSWRKLTAGQDISWSNAYGPTETTVTVTQFEPNREFPDYCLTTVPIGRPCANSHVYILDKYQQAVPVGVAGEIYIAGAQVGRGYLHQPDMTRSRFVTISLEKGERITAYRSGDIGCWRNDGNIEFLGRNDHQIKIRGYRIEPGEIESCLLACKDVSQALVTLHDSGEENTQLVAYLLAAQGKTLDIHRLRNQLTRTLPDYMVPAALIPLSAWPLLPSGKINRRALPAPGRDTRVENSFISPADAVEAQIADEWKALLGLDEVGRFDNFFELGGHSLLAVKLIERLSKLDITLDIKRIYSAPTIAAMAEIARTGASMDGAETAARNYAISQESRQSLVDDDEYQRLSSRIVGGTDTIEDVYPLTPFQQGILFHHRMAQDHDPYLMRVVVSFASMQHLTAFANAMQSAMDRHPILRSSVHWQDLVTPLQVVHKHANFIATPLHFDLQNPLPTFLEVTSPQNVMLNLEQAPVVKAFYTGGQKENPVYLAVIFHHVLVDNLTIQNLFSEINQQLDNPEAQLPPALPYREFVSDVINTPLDNADRYFEKLLAGFAEPHQFHSFIDPALDHADQECRLNIPAPPSHRIRLAAKNSRVSVASLFHLAWSCVIANHCNTRDVVFGTVVTSDFTGRQQNGQRLGQFINTLPIRLQLRHQPLSNALADTFQQLNSLVTHAHGSLSQVQHFSAVHPPFPLFSSLLNYRHTIPGSTNIGFLQMDTRSHYPITLSIDDDGQQFTLVAQGRQGIAASRLLHHFNHALQALTQALEHAPQHPVDALSLTPPEELLLLQKAFNQNVFPTTPHGSVLQQITRHANHSPHATALVYEKDRWSYQTLVEHILQLSAILHAQGVGPHARVAIILERSPLLIASLLAVLECGATYIPLDPTHPDDRLEYIIKDAGAGLILASPTGLERFSEITLDVYGVNDALSIGRVDAEIAIPQGAIDSLAYIIYTSGTTGLPKGVGISHENLSRMLSATQTCLALDAQAVWTQCHSIAFDFSVWEIFGALTQGATLVIVPHSKIQDSQAFLKLLAKERVSVLSQTPSAFRLLLNPDLPATYLPALRHVIFGGEALDITLIDRWEQRHSTPDVQWVNMYGITEITVHATWQILPADATQRSRFKGSIGRPLPGLQIHILENGRPVPIGVKGELHISGPQVAKGYVNRPGHTAQRFVSLPIGSQTLTLYKTGDQGRWHPDASIEFLGRLDDQVKIRGYRIELGEIENCLKRQNDILDATVIVDDHFSEDPQLTAYLHPSRPVDLDALHTALRKQLPVYMLPLRYECLPVMPLTPQGKIDKRALKQSPATQRPLATCTAPRNDTEQQLLSIWQEVLRAPALGVTDDFFQVGGNSLLATQVIARINRNFGIDLPISELFECSTIEQLAMQVLASLCGTETEEQLESLLAEV